jgi:hypothetical protein
MVCPASVLSLTNQSDLRFDLVRGLFEGRDHHPARGAPRGPEIDQHQDVVTVDL